MAPPWPSVVPPVAKGVNRPAHILPAIFDPNPSLTHPDPTETCPLRPVSCIKPGEANRKGQKGRQRLPIIHGENIVLYLPELEENSFLVTFSSGLVFWCNQLKVFHRCNWDPTLEIQIPASFVWVPPRRFVLQNCVSRTSRFLLIDHGIFMTSVCLSFSWRRAVK